MDREIRAFYTDNIIRVYQAYNKVIAEEAVQKGTFGSSFKMDRMTWIKPSFLWMMYRCGWAAKENIADITDYVKDLNEQRLKRKDISSLLPEERVYTLGEVYGS